MANWVIQETVDLHKMPKQAASFNLMFPLDEAAHTWQVTVLEDGEAVDLSGGTLTAYFLRKDGDTVAVSGTISGNVCSVVFAQACYAVPGAVAAGMRLTKDGATVTLAYRIFNVLAPYTSDSYIDPGEVVPSLQELLAKIDDCETAAEAATAAAQAASQEASVKYNAAQSLTAAQKAQVWENIGLAVDDTLSVEGAAADAKEVGDALAVADKDIAQIPYAAKTIGIDLVPSDQAWHLRNGYIRHAGLSSPGQISGNASYTTYSFRARQDLLITGCDFPNVDANHWGCIRVSNEEPVTGVGNPWTGNLYDSITGNIPTSESPATVLKGQWVAVNYYRTGTAGDSWTLHLQETGAKILQPDIPMTPAMKAYVDARIAELQALILENN